MKKKDRHSSKWAQVIVRLDDEDHSRLKHYSVLNKSTISDVVRVLIRKHCVDYEKD